MIDSLLYQQDISVIINSIDKEKLKNKNILVTGACGLIGSVIIDTLMTLNKKYFLNIGVIAYAHTKENLVNRFSKYLGEKCFHYICQDICKSLDYQGKVDYIMHLASNADPKSFSNNPVEIITANIIGLKNLLDYAREHHVLRVLYTSSGEVYGKASCDVKEFKEDFNGYVDIRSSRSCYPLSKRCAENLCISYSEEYHIDTVIVRPSHVYGPTMTKNDSRVYAEFIRNILNNQDITLKSPGLQIRSYCYVFDCVSGIFQVLLKGKTKEAYNIANKKSVVSIKELASIIAQIGNKKVIYDIPTNVSSNANPMMCGVLNSEKIEALDWEGHFDIKMGLSHTIDILKEIK